MSVTLASRHPQKTAKTRIPVSIVILSHDRRAEVERNLPRLLEECRNEDEFQIIVVDNASTDGTPVFLREMVRLHPQITVVFNDSNKGVAGGRNTGYALTVREFVVALDDDTAIAAADLRRVPGLFQAAPEAGLLAFRVVHSASGEQQNPHGDQPCPVANHHGAGFAFRRNLYQKLGGIDEECDFGAEELDFAIRVHADGWQLRYTPEITVYHNNIVRNCGENQRRIERRIYNNIRTYHKYFPRPMAALHAWRYIVPYLRRWCRDYGVMQIHRALRVALRGAKAGLRATFPTPPATVRYYSDRRLRPEVGNVPLTEKLLRKCRKGARSDH